MQRECVSDEDALRPQMANCGVIAVQDFRLEMNLLALSSRLLTIRKKGQSDVVQWVFCKDHSTGGTHYQYARKALTRTPMAGV